MRSRLRLKRTDSAPGIRKARWPELRQMNSPMNWRPSLQRETDSCGPMEPADGSTPKVLWTPNCEESPLPATSEPVAPGAGPVLHPGPSPAPISFALCTTEHFGSRVTTLVHNANHEAQATGLPGWAENQADCQRARGSEFGIRISEFGNSTLQPSPLQPRDLSLCPSTNTKFFSPLFKHN